MKQFFQQAIIFTLLLCIPLLGVEFSLRSQREIPFWFNGYSDIVKHENADVVFVGNSLIQAAVRPDRFAELISIPGQPPRRAVNLGEGYTTSIEYLFGLRRWLEVNPHVFENSVVVLPAPGGMPDAHTWTDDWMRWQEPQLLTAYVTFPEVWKYCTTVDVSLAEKALLVGGKLSTIVAQGGLLRVAVMHQFDLLAEFLTTGGKIEHHQVNVVTEGGIITDVAFMDYMRKLIIKVEKEARLNQKPVDWDKCVIKDIAAFIKAHGGRLCFCYIPVSSVQQETLDTAIRKKDIENFERAAEKWQCLVLKPAYKPKDDSAFPDLTHMDKDASEAYTKSLAQIFPFRH